MLKRPGSAIATRKKGDPVDKETYEKARALYFDYMSITKIAEVLGLGRTTIQNWVNKGWREARELDRVSAMKDFTQRKKADFMGITDASVQVLCRSIEHLKERDRAPTIQEMKGVAYVLEVLDRITRLDDGKPTEITHSETTQPAIEVLAKLKRDPLFDEAEYEEIANSIDDSDDVVSSPDSNSATTDG